MRVTSGLIPLFAGTCAMFASVVATAAPDQKTSGGRDTFTQADANSDGAVTLDEAQAYQRQWFTQLDRDGNSALARQELVGPAETDGLSRQEKELRQQRLAAFKQLDADGDGRITNQEYSGNVREAIAKTDADGDGRISREEVRARTEELQRKRSE